MTSTNNNNYKLKFTQHYQTKLLNLVDTHRFKQKF